MDAQLWPITDIYTHLPTYSHFLFTYCEMWQKLVNATSDAPYCHHEYDLLGYDTTKYGRSLSLFRRNILPLSSGSMNKPSKQQSKYALCCLLGLLFDPLKRWQTSTILHGVTSHKTGLYMVITTRTSDLAYFLLPVKLSQQFTTMPQSMYLYLYLQVTEKYFCKVCSRYGDRQ
jgi:hypothetical protein